MTAPSLGASIRTVGSGDGRSSAIHRRELARRGTVAFVIDDTENPRRAEEDTRGFNRITRKRGGGEEVLAPPAPFISLLIFYISSFFALIFLSSSTPYAYRPGVPA